MYITIGSETQTNPPIAGPVVGVILAVILAVIVVIALVILRYTLTTYFSPAIVCAHNRRKRIDSQSTRKPLRRKPYEREEDEVSDGEDGLEMKDLVATVEEQKGKYYSTILSFLHFSA